MNTRNDEQQYLCEVCGIDHDDFICEMCGRSLFHVVQRRGAVDVMESNAFCDQDRGSIVTSVTTACGYCDCVETFPTVLLDDKAITAVVGVADSLIDSPDECGPVGSAILN